MAREGQSHARHRQGAVGQVLNLRYHADVPVGCTHGMHGEKKSPIRV